jgi:hypothetical protein
MTRVSQVYSNKVVEIQLLFETSSSSSSLSRSWRNKFWIQIEILLSSISPWQQKILQFLHGNLSPGRERPLLQWRRVLDAGGCKMIQNEMKGSAGNIYKGATNNT